MFSTWIAGAMAVLLTMGIIVASSTLVGCLAIAMWGQEAKTLRQADVGRGLTTRTQKAA